MSEETVSGAKPPYVIEPLANHHDRAAFYCGVTELDRYFREQASQDLKKKVAASFVMVDQNRRVVGYYTLSSFAVHVAELPSDRAKKLPKYPLIPCTLLGRLAVDQKYRGQKLGRLLLMDALRRSWKNSANVASVGIVVDAYDDLARQFYIHHEFVPLLEHPKKLFIAMQILDKIFS